MPDESPRSTPGNWPEQSHDAAPAWWNSLGRGDLPDDRGHRPVEWLDDTADLNPPARRSFSHVIAIVAAVSFVTAVVLVILRSVIPQSAVGDGAFLLIPLAVAVITGTVLADRPRS